MSLVEEPGNLWLDPGHPNDRASASFLQGLPSLQSLYLIRPEAFKFCIRSKVWEGKAKKQQRGLFRYKGRPYDFALTDPLVGQKYYSDYPRTPDGFILRNGSCSVLLCMSLARAFTDLHYKVIATVLELPL